MRRKRSLCGVAVATALVLGAGCSHPPPDPPPPALSGGLPAAPPGALGAHAASHPAPPATEPTDELPSAPPPPFLPHSMHPPSEPPAVAAPDAGAGVSL
jgi:hypothetical protein